MCPGDVLPLHEYAKVLSIGPDEALQRFMKVHVRWPNSYEGVIYISRKALTRVLVTVESAANGPFDQG